MASSSSTKREGKSVPEEPLKKRKRDDDDANRSNVQFQATCDQKEQQIDQEEEPAPYVILVQGPPNVGKSLLIKSLVKFYTKRSIKDIRGPITIIAGKKRRLQFVECPNDVCGMIDASKYADVVLLLIDASYGFEMETFEFVNLIQVHGVPKVMGVLTHLDDFKDIMKMSETKQCLRLQFWTEICDGAELFYLSGLHRGMYRKSQIHKLARFISDMKLPPLSWRATHPYVLVDHFEDITPPERVHMDKKCVRNITLDGYLRGCDIKKGTKVHIAGVGDFPIADITRLPDPCPLPSAAKMNELKGNEIFFYAPMPDLGNLLDDQCLAPNESVQLSEENGKCAREDAMKTFDAATEEQKLRRLALQAIFVADFPFLKGSGSPDEESDSRRGSEFHEQQANCGGYSDKVEEVDIQKQINFVDVNNLDGVTCLEFEGMRKGTYLRLEVCDVPSEMVENFDPYHPILVGGISLEEENVGYMQARLKQHSWHTKLLKTRDPITVSIGWRRYQTTPVYAVEETRRTGSHEMLHYAPEHRDCLAMFWGPLASSNTGLVAVQSVPGDKAAFQITATGFLLGFNQAEKIVMEHKQKGTPYKIIGNTALIQDMFTSDLDVARHKDVVIWTASGIRGKVIEAARKKLVYKLMRKGDKPSEGIARCAFHREIRMSDEFFMVVWKPVQVPRSFNPYTASQFRDSLDKDDPTRRRQTLGQRRVVVFPEGEPRSSRQLLKEYKIKKKQKAVEKKKSEMLVFPEEKMRFRKKLKWL
ncbi:ribosome biogenesis protein BMS1 homolog isoform X1 [Papaver somniferum]|uniref:ribosome biogenesis protein BMS1 homolog isoform X1 n=1 Tax=Papaver somniferum TaxID=3469 RepID=UPI000E6FB93D|nr:ribosome biogenesis protein BMS1 homolog isoform X1 [Papaver somniferum]